MLTAVVAELTAQLEKLAQTCCSARQRRAHVAFDEQPCKVDAVFCKACRADRPARPFCGQCGSKLRSWCGVCGASIDYGQGHACHRQASYPQQTHPVVSHERSDVSITSAQWLTAACIVVLQLLDTVTTLQGIALGGKEINPIVRFALYVGDEWFIGAKVVATILMVLIALATRFAVWPLILISFVYGYVVWNNFEVLARLKSGSP